MPKSRPFPHLRVLGPFLAVVIMLAGMAVLTVDVMSAVRAYVGGESLWSKARREAIQHLDAYIAQPRTDRFEAFEHALSVPLGDRRARLELDRPRPDLARVREGFIAGGNHPQDLSGMIRLYRLFRDVSFVADAIDIWAAADATVEELQAFAREIRREAEQGTGFDPERQADLQAQTAELSARLQVLEHRFSATLGEASRATQALLIATTALLSTLLVLFGGGFIWRALRTRARSEQTLRESNERWDMAAQAASVGLFEWRLDSGALRLDARARTMLGLPVEEAPLLSVSALLGALAPVDSGRVEQAVHGADDDDVLTLRVHVDRSPTPVRHLALVCRKHAATADAPARVVGVLRDITAELFVEQLRVEKEAAERAAQSRFELLSRISHELRTPLNAILGFAQVMQHDTAQPLPQVHARRNEQILASGRHLLALVNDVLDLSRSEVEGLAMQSEAVQVDEILRTSLLLVQPLLTADRAGIVVDCPPTDARVLADRLRLGQVLVNLLSNAVKYNRPDGRIAIECARVGGGVEIAVSDNGQGLSGEQIARLFRPFDRLGAERGPVSGTGLGLVISRQLVERMGGRLEVSSEPGVGSRFAVVLQAA